MGAWVDQAELDERLRSAARDGKHSALVYQLAQGANPLASCPESQQTALNLAARCPDPACALTLLPLSDPAARDDLGRTPLMSACWAGSFPCAQALLPASDPLARDRNGWSALMLAARTGPRAHACAMLLLPVSNPLALSHDNFRARNFAQHSGNQPLADLLFEIEAALELQAQLRAELPAPHPIALPAKSL